MRLRTCIALELAAAVSLMGTIGAGAVIGLGYLRANLAGEALAAEAELGTTAVAPRIEQAVRIEPVAAGVLDPGALETTDARPYQDDFDGKRDEELIEPLRTGAITRVKFNRGGSSVSLRIDFDNGARAAFKPEQTNPQTVPRKEIAAFRINRLLGLNTVPPAIARTFKAADIFRAIDARSAVFVPRIEQEMIVEGGQVTGELSWWIPVLEPARVDGYEMDSTDGIVTWKRYLGAGHEIPESAYDIVSQISNMVLFDFIINNPDRWSGANAKASADGKLLYFMDNTLSFALEDEGHRRCKTYLERAQKFSFKLVMALRDMTEERVREALSYDRGPYRALLTEAEIASMMKRREWALAYLDKLLAKHGEADVLVFP